MMKRALFILYLCFILAIFEILCQVGIRIVTGRWLFQTETRCYQELFQRHPWLVIAPKTNVSCGKGNLMISFNSLGFRGQEIPLKKYGNQKRIICYGGSTTFGTKVSDNQTWPVYLEDALGKNKFQVINAGVPGYSSVEAIIQTALQQFDLSPDICIYYEGWNDVRNMHVQNLKSDYSDFHGPSQVTNFRLDGWLINNKLASAQLLRFLTQKITSKTYSPQGQISDLLDERALNIYIYNLETIINICKARQIKPVMVPQVLNYRMFKSDKPHDWAPLIREGDVQRFMKAYNQAMIDLCVKEEVLCISSVLDEDWKESDFVDNGHFSPQGNRKFADLIAQELKK